MTATAVKVCGITRREDAELAVELGARAIGFVFADSPRRVAVEDARAIAAALAPAVERVGVFVDASAAVILRVAAAVPLTRVQLHGSESPGLVASLPIGVTRALALVESFPSVDAAESAVARLDAEVRKWRAARADLSLLLDLPKHAVAFAAARERLWDVARVLAASVPLALAGGLDPDNVAAALARARPSAGVDVARGVESSPGRKDPARLRAFFAAVAAFDASEAR